MIHPCRSFFISVLLTGTFALIGCQKSNDTVSTETEEQIPAMEAEIDSSIDVVAVRHEAMHNWQETIGYMGDLLKNTEEFNPEDFKLEAQFIAGDSDRPWPYFANKEAGEGGADPAVWDNKEGFQAEVNKFIAAANNLSEVAESAQTVDDVTPAFEQLTATCQSCHVGFKR